jgi:hypothetical protein
MSTHIVDRIEAIRFPKEATGLCHDDYLVAELGGDNNVRDNRGRRARSWSATAIGQEWEVIKQACEFAACCSGGMLKLRGRVTKPEAYIRAYRKALATAATLEEARRGKGLYLRARIRFTEEEKKSWHFQQLAKTRTPRIETPFGEPQSVFDFDLNSREDTNLWLEHCHRAGWHNAEVDGPGEV